MPRVIECFDISNHGADFAVGSMSRFVDGRPDKSGYRKFRIKTVSGRDDFAMISEVVKRRYYRLLGEDGDLPDLVVIDGGRGQLNAALKSLTSLGLKLPCVSLAKENEEVYVPKRPKPVVIPRGEAVAEDTPACARRGAQVRGGVQQDHPKEPDEAREPPRLTWKCMEKPAGTAAAAPCPVSG